jgi:disulfide bond formation protein DsbB
MANLILRVGLALAIVGVAIGMTAAASETVSPCSPPSCATSAADAYARPGGPADIAVSAANASAAAVDATLLVGLVTVVVIAAIFAILLSYRPRPGGVRAQDR